MKVRELLSDESKWTKRSFARDMDGIITPLESERACAWCLLGAIERCYPIGIVGILARVNTKLGLNVVGGSIGQWNDDQATTFPMVKALVEELDI